MENFERLLVEAFAGGEIVSLLLQGPRTREEGASLRVLVKPVQVRGKRAYQFAYQGARKVTHRNMLEDEATAEARDLLATEFKEARIQTTTADYHILLNRKNEAIIHRTPKVRAQPALRHDRQKRYVLEEGKPIPFLARLGVMTAEGKVIAAKYDKFRQINRFLEIAGDIAGQLPEDGPLRIVDFGSGKATLTFALYHLFHEAQQRDVTILGLDLKEDVVAFCNQAARDLKFEGLTFQAGEIAQFAGMERADMVVSLHACDTATDDALAKAIQWDAKVILAAPCCQHELFRQLQNRTMQPLLKHGILKDRLTGLVTDALRGQFLELAGYSVQMLEFVDPEHTPKNLLIRAVKPEKAGDRARRLAEYRAFRDAWGVRPRLETLLPEIAQAESVPKPG